MIKFIAFLLSRVVKNYWNNYSDNFDFYMFKSEEKKEDNNFEFFKKNFLNIFRSRQNFNYLVNLLEDQESKNLILDLLSYRILGYKKFKLPLSRPEYWQRLEEINTQFFNKDKIKLKNSRWTPRRIDLKNLNLPLKIYTIPQSVMTKFILNQYEYKKVKIKKNDIVLDAGACWGDTSLLFAYQVGRYGKVFAFEFIPENLKVFFKNISLNQLLAKRIHLCKKPLWGKSNINSFYLDKGPSSKILIDEDNKDKKNTLKTISIDDFIHRNKIRRIDFIKMDIEGAELQALKGAKTTLSKYKPRLAISIYHSLKDFIEIPKFLGSLNIGYKFYLKHSTIHLNETVLFAI